jgi:superoxide dismutase, Cu-Zn family
MAIMVGAVLVVTPIGCAYRGGSMVTPAAAHASTKPATVLFSSATLTIPGPALKSKAVTYNRDLAPIGAAMTVAIIPSPDGFTRAKLAVSGLLPHRGYAVHAHTNSCGAIGDAAGPHFQNRVDPAATPRTPSNNPEYANPSNEIWLDVRTDATGAGTSDTTVPFVLTDRTPGSIVLHEAM